MNLIPVIFVSLTLNLINCYVMRNERNVCDTTECQKAKDKVLQYIDSTVDPCEDFYHYSCGNFIKHTIIPDHYEKVTQMTEIQIKVDDQLKEILNEPILNTDLKIFQDTKKVYQSCMNINAVENVGITPLLEMIKKLDGCPVLGDRYWEEKKEFWSFERVSRKLFENGFSSNFILSLIVETDHRNTSVRMAKILLADLGIDRQYFIRKDARYEAYKNLQVDFVQMLGSTLSREEIELKMAKVLDFENSLAMIPKRRIINPTSIRELQEDYPYLDWLSFLNSIMPDETEFVSRDIINDSYDGFLDKLRKLVFETPKEVLANYIMWRVALESAPYLNKAIKDRYFEYKSAFNGKTADRSRDIWCVIVTNYLIPKGTSALYVRHHFKKETKVKIEQMIEYIMNAFKDNLKNLQWMDEKTKKAVLVKAKALRAIAGAPDELYNDVELEKYHTNFNTDIDVDKFYESVFKLKKVIHKYDLNKLRKTAVRTDWTTHNPTAMANAYINHGLNRIEILAALLQDPIYNENLPQYFNYGGVGNIIGHELTHAFDNTGSRFDENGNFKNWWTDESFRKFSNLNKCFVEQFGNFTEPKTGLKLNGTSSQGENIADTGGFKFAYRAYEKWIEDNGEESLLPDIKLNQRQLFWVSAAQSRCSVSRKEYLEDLLIVDVHPPHQFRVIGSIGNQPEFSRDFNCSVTSRMNFQKKCRVW